MAMTTMHNLAAQGALSELSRNNNKLSKSLRQVASGMKINSAQDDSAEFSISEKMRVQIRGLEQDTVNVQLGKSLLRVASGGIGDIVDELRQLKELAINAADDHNTDQDRAVLQREFEQRIANIDDIASTTNYNGKTLLDGTYRRGRYVVKPPAGLTHEEPVGTTTVIPGGDYTISSDGVYMLSAGYTGTVTIAAGVKDVKIQQEDPSTELHNVSIVGPPDGEANLWIEDLNIGHTGTANIIKFQGDGNFLTLKGTNNLCNDCTSGYYGSEVIQIGEGLTIEGSSGGTLNASLRDGRYHSGEAAHRGASCIGTSASSTAELVINSGNFNI